MIESLHPAASHHLPAFFTSPGETDVLMVVTAVILGLSVLGFGIVFLRLHTMPERIAHRTNKLQFEIVAVLGLLALFTHVHLFWVAGLLLALIELPDFGGALNRIAGGVETMAGIKSPEPEAATAHGPAAAEKPPGATGPTETAAPAPAQVEAAARLGPHIVGDDGARAAPKRPELAPVGTGS